jgi:hypothetical protein
VAEDLSWVADGLDTSKPSIARICDYFVGARADALVPGSCLVISQASDEDKPADRAAAKLRSTGLSRVRPAHRAGI